MTDEEAHAAFVSIRWSDNAGQPYCPRCGCVAAYACKTRPTWKCKGCTHQYSVTSGTIFADRKMAIRDILLAIAIFVNGAKGHSALQLSRDLDCQYKTAFVLSHKIREAICGLDKGETVSGDVEIDGAYFGGYVKPANHKENRVDRRRAMYQTGKRRVVIVMRERGGKTLTFVSKSEDASVPVLRSRIEPGSTVYADEASPLGPTSCPLPDEADQSFAGLQHCRGLHEHGRKLFLSPPSGGDWHSPSRRRPLPRGLRGRDGLEGR